jgi:hypothetical protein
MKMQITSKDSLIPMAYYNCYNHLITLSLFKTILTYKEKEKAGAVRIYEREEDKNQTRVNNEVKEVQMGLGFARRQERKIEKGCFTCFLFYTSMHVCLHGHYY